MRLTLDDVIAATGGRGTRAEGVEIESVAVDTRVLVPGALFVALPGGRDGHSYVGDAFARGAAAVMVSAPVDSMGPLVYVADTLAALGDLGRLARERAGDAQVVAITGSTGKTSTKDLAAAAVGAARRVTASPASFNNEAGVPLTLLAARTDDDVVICEMGARGRGHIAALCAIAVPHVGVVTNIGVAHAQLFGSPEETAGAKGELLEALPPAGTAVLLDSDRFTPALAARTAARVLRVGTSPSAEVRATGVRVDGELHASFTVETPWGSAAVRLAVRGAHQVANAAMAIAVAGSVGVPLEAAAAGLAAAAPSKWRMELTRTDAGVVVINDAYNANPASVAAALHALADLEVAGRRIAVLGEMAELGALAAPEHQAVGALAARLGIDVVVVVGGVATAPLASAARAAGATTVTVEDPAAAGPAVAALLAPGDAVLVKASRVVGLERVAESLLEWRAGGVRA